MAKALSERRRERDRLVALASSYVEELASRLPVTAAAVVGSVARGDFNVWSDVDVVVIAQGLPDRVPERAALLTAGAPGGIQLVGFTPDEFERAWRKRNPLAREATSGGIVLRGEAFLRGFGPANEAPETRC